MRQVYVYRENLNFTPTRKYFYTDISVTFGNSEYLHLNKIFKKYLNIETKHFNIICDNFDLSILDLEFVHNNLWQRNFDFKSNKTFETAMILFRFILLVLNEAFAHGQ